MPWTRPAEMPQMVLHALFECAFTEKHISMPIDVRNMHGKEQILPLHRACQMNTSPVLAKHNAQMVLSCRISAEVNNCINSGDHSNKSAVHSKYHAVQYTNLQEEESICRQDKTKETMALAEKFMRDWQIENWLTSTSGVKTMQRNLRLTS